jgi:hypothetical protein
VTPILEPENGDLKIHHETREQRENQRIGVGGYLPQEAQVEEALRFPWKAQSEGESRNRASIIFTGAKPAPHLQISCAACHCASRPNSPQTRAIYSRSIMSPLTDNMPRKPRRCF